MLKNKKYKLVVFDQDGVLVLGDALDDMAIKLGAKTASLEITRLWHEHKIDLGEAIRRKQAVLDRYPADEVLAARCNIKFDPDALATVAALWRRGIKTMVITGSPEITARYTQKTLGLDFMAATTKNLTLEKEKKLIPLAAKLKELKINFTDIIAVGDSFSDEAMLQRAGLGLVIRPRPGLAEKFREIRSLKEILDYV
jgi:phosphoserine phosphatase